MEYDSEQQAPASQESAPRWSSRPQFTAIATASIIFLSAGMNLALSVGWFQFSLFGPMQHFCYSWFIGVIIGTVVSIPLRYILSTKLITAISSFMVIVNGVIFASSPTLYNVLLAGRYINGIAVGLSVVPFIMYATELADDSCRCACMAMEQCFLGCGIAIQMILTSYWSSDMQFPPNRVHGILDIIFGAVPYLSVRYFVVSPMDHIRKGDDAAALESLASLHRPPTVTAETQLLLAQHKTYIQQQDSLTLWQSIGNGLVPLFKLLLFRSTILALSNSLTLNTAFHYSMLAKSVTWVPVVAALCRITGSLISLGVADKIVRKLPSILYALSIGGLCLNHARLFYNIYDTVNLSIAKYVYMPIQVCVGLFAPYTTIYMTEAFPLKVKPIMMAICVVIEQILHIILICITKPLIAENLSGQAGIISMASIFLCLTMPDTRNTLLSEAQQRIRKLFNLALR